MPYKILLVDDNDELMKSFLDVFLKDMGQVDIAGSAAQCLRSAARKRYDLIFLDIALTPNGFEGIDLLEKLKQECPATSFIMLTSHDDVKVIARCKKLGADDFVSKNSKDFAQELSTRAAAVLSKRRSEKEYFSKGLELAKEVGAVFRSDSMREVYATVAKMRDNSETHVLIEGPTGSGKELIAQAVGQKSNSRPFFAINCASIPENLLESELFGHERGAFTGANSKRLGRFELADKGDLFLDEIHYLSLDSQAKLLRVLQSGEFNRVGGNAKLTTSARVIAATNQNLSNLVKKGLFKEDLYHRLVEVKINVSSLTERREDIIPIAEAVIARSKNPEAELTYEVKKAFTEYDWPGNVRQLVSITESMIMNSASNHLTVGDLPAEYWENFEFNKQDPAFVFQPKKTEADFNSASKNFSLSYIRHYARMIQQPVSLQKLADRIGLEKSTLSKKLGSLGVKLEQNGELVAANA